MCHNARVSHTKKMQYPLHLGPRGRVVLPAPVRRELGLEEGDRLVLTIEGSGKVTIRSLREQAKKCAGLFARVAPGRNLVDELLAERREEARRESAR